GFEVGGDAVLVQVRSLERAAHRVDAGERDEVAEQACGLVHGGLRFAGGRRPSVRSDPIYRVGGTADPINRVTTNGVVVPTPPLDEGYAAAGPRPRASPFCSPHSAPRAARRAAVRSIIAA